MEQNITQKDIVSALFMLHSQMRDQLPEYIIRENHPMIKDDNDLKPNLSYQALTDPLIADLAEIAMVAKDDQETKDFLNLDEHKEKLLSVLYASQFHDQAFTIGEIFQNYSIQKPCKVLASVIHADFYKGYFSFLDEVEILPDIKCWVAHQELLTVANILSDYVDKNDDPKLQKVNTIAVLSDSEIEQRNNEIPTLVYPETIFSNPKRIQEVATFIRADLFQEDFYVEYSSMDEYFDRSPYAKAFINTVLNDSKAVHFDEKTALEAIAEIHGIRDYKATLFGYEIDLDSLYRKYNDSEADIEDIENEIIDERNAALELAYDNDEYVDELLVELSIEEKEEELDEEIDSTTLIALNSRFEVPLLQKEIAKLKYKRPSNRFYADHKYSSLLEDNLTSVIKGEEVDLYDLVSVINETAMTLSFFDKDGVVLSLCENFLATVKDVLQEYDKNYDDNLFKNSKSLYAGFKKSKREISETSKKQNDPLDDIKYTRRPDGYEGGFKGHPPEI